MMTRLFKIPLFGYLQSRACGLSLYYQTIKKQLTMSRIHIEDYSLRGGYARALIDNQEVEFNFTMTQAINSAIDLKFIIQPFSHDNDVVVATHPLFPGEMATQGIERKCKMTPLSVLNELSGDEQNELVRHLAVQQYEIHI